MIQTTGGQRNQTASGPRNQTAGGQRNQAVGANQKQAPLCVVCKERPQYSKAGTTYPTCGLSCAQKLPSGSGSQTMCCICADICYSDESKHYPTCGMDCAAEVAKLKRSDTPARMCNYCHQRPKYHDGVTIYPHCSTKCRDSTRQEIANLKAKLSRPSAPSNTNTACLMCWNAKASSSDLCNKCMTLAEKTGGSLLEAPRGHTAFNEVAAQFKKAWNGLQCPDVLEVYKIVEPLAYAARHSAYRDKINGNGRLMKSKGHEYHQWHGTHRQCKGFDPGHLDVCVLPSCLLCTTIRGSFDLEIFAPGIYTSKMSSESHMDSEERKTMLLVNVLVGKEIQLTPDEDPQIDIKDYDAARVIGHIRNGRPVDKLISYDKDAVQPLYIVVYG